jgi:peptide deformylase
LRVRESRPVYTDGEVSYTQAERVVGPTPTSDSLNCDSSNDVEETETVCIERRPVFVLHPHITYLTPEQIVIEEGCLSVPTSYASTFGGDNDIPLCVRRPVGLTMSYTDLQGVPCHIRVDGLEDEHQKWVARCIQHEYDHLDGILYTDKLHHEDAI